MKFDSPSNPARTFENDEKAESQGERAQFDLAERAARIGYWRLRLSDNHLTWSPGMYRLLGVDPAVQKPDNPWLHEQIVPEDVEMFTAVITRAIRERTTFNYVTRAKYPEAAAQIVETHGELEIGPDGRVVAVIGVCHDITKQVVAETEREEAQAMYRLMTNEASDVILLYEPGGRMLFASNALHHLLKRKITDIGYGKIFDIVHPEDLAEAHKLNWRPNPDQTIISTYRIRHGDGHYVWIESKTRGFYDDNGELKNCITVSRDVSERKAQELIMRAAQERAEAANRAKSSFLANMSHELRTPLNAIIGFADVMRQKLFGPLGGPRYEEYASLIYDSGQLLLDLISDVLDMAKIEAGKFDLHYEQVNLRDTIDDCLRLVSDRAQKGNVGLTAEMPDTDTIIIADHRAIKQILLNLLSNAVKFTPKGGRVTISAASVEDCMRICVRDNGIGIPASELPRLGQPFAQISTDPVLTKNGTGLGLALVHALVAKHGGTTHIESAEGEGTSVSVVFPLKPLARAAA
ncbi:MAG TPA: PAS domain-containing sensor histidine kinase [Rhizomicrobium sp.]|nr:PAS domain-containing sensor histidine kinase [Rhizomicrobium sp.]